MEARDFSPRPETIVPFRNLILLSQAVRVASNLPREMYIKTLESKTQLVNDALRAFRQIILDKLNRNQIDKSQSDLYRTAIRAVVNMTKQGYLEFLSQDKVLSGNIIDFLWTQVQIEKLRMYLSESGDSFEMAAKTLSHIIRNDIIGCHKASVWGTYFDLEKIKYFIVPFAWLEDEASKPDKLYLDPSMFQKQGYGFIRDIAHKMIYEEDLRKSPGFHEISLDDLIVPVWNKDPRIFVLLDEQASQTTKHFNGMIIPYKDPSFALMKSKEEAVFTASFEGESPSHKKKCIFIQLINSLRGFTIKDYYALEPIAPLFLELCYNLSDSTSTQQH